ncbi:MAG: hypothetical protein XD66_1104, partial [Thermacetogenium phaeum]
PFAIHGPDPFNRILQLQFHSQHPLSCMLRKNFKSPGIRGCNHTARPIPKYPAATCAAQSGPQAAQV